MSRENASFFLVDLGKRETTFGTAITGFAGAWYKYTDRPLPVLEIVEDTDLEEAKGVVGVTSHKQIAKRGTLSLNFKFQTGLFHYLLANLMANTTPDAGPTNFTHVVKEPGNAVVSPWSFPVIFASDRADTGGFLEYRGCSVNRLSAVREDKGPWLASCDLLHDGSETSKSGETPPALGSSSAGTRLYSFETTTLFGPVGNEDVSASVRRIEFEFTAGLEEVDLDSRGVNVGRYDYGANEPNLSVNLQLAGGRDSTFYNYWKNQTACILNLLIQQGADNSFRLQVNTARANAENGTPFEWRNRTEGVVNLPLRGEYTVADVSKFIATTKDQTAAYAAAS